MLLRLTALFIIFFACSGSVVAQQQPAGKLLQTPLRPGLKKGRVADFLADIRRQTGYSVSFASNVLDSTRRIVIPSQRVDLAALFELIFVGQSVEAVESSSGTGILIIPRTVSDRTAGQYRIVTGRLRERGSGEVLIGASVYDPALRTGTTTNAYGLFQLALPEGERMVCVTYVGYNADTFQVPPTGNLRKDIDLEATGEIEEVSIKARNQGMPGDRIHVAIAGLAGQPQGLGSLDPMRELQTISGVQPATNTSSGVIVRGGSPGQNLYLLDGVPLYYVDHFFGLTSVYNSDALKSVDFYKSAFPSRFGGRISSVIDAHGRDGDLQKFGGGASIGLLQVALDLEGPVVKDKASVMLSGRRSWIDGLLTALPESPGVYFYDANAKVQWLINKNHRLYGGFYTGRDLLRLGSESATDGSYQRLRWSNTVSSLRWNAVLSPRLISDIAATYSQLVFDQRQRVLPVDTALSGEAAFDIGSSTIREGAVNAHFQWTPTGGQTISSGFRLAQSQFVPTAAGRQIGEGPVEVGTNLSSKFGNTEISAFIENALRFGDKWTVRPGLRATAWVSGDFSYLSVQPRFYAAYRPRRYTTYYVTGVRMGQFLHLLSSNSFGLTNDFWVPSTAQVRPEESWQAGMGANRRLGKNMELNVEGYYKYTDGVISYVTGKSLFDNSDRWQDKITQGAGWSYGSEVSATYKTTRWDVSAAYTLSWNWQQFAKLNGGAAFPYRYDRRNNLNLKATYSPSHRFNAVAQFIYLTGEAFTLPDQLYPDLDQNLLYTGVGIPKSDNYTYSYSAWNAYRLPDVHRLDLGANFIRRRGLRYVRTWSAGIYNAYGRANVNFITLRQQADGALSLEGLALIRFLPYVSFKVRF